MSKKIQVFSSFGLEPILLDDYDVIDVAMIPGRVFLIEDGENTKKYIKNNDNAIQYLKSLNIMTGVEDYVEYVAKLKYPDQPINSIKRLKPHISEDYPIKPVYLLKNKKYTKNLLMHNGQNIDPFVLISPQLSDLEAIEDKTAYLLSIKNSIHSQRKKIRLHNIIRIKDSNGREQNRRILYKGKMYNINNFNAIQQDMLWIIIFNTLYSSKDTDLTVQEMLKKEEYLTSIKSQFYSLTLYYHDKTNEIINAFYSKEIPCSAASLKTIDERDSFLRLTQKDVEKILYNVKTSNRNTLIELKMNSTNKKNTINTWIDKIQHDIEDDINANNINELLAHHTFSQMGKIFISLAQSGDDNLVNKAQSIFSLENPYTDSKLTKLSMQSHMAEILNLFGRDYIINHMKISHMKTLYYLSKYPIPIQKGHKIRIDWLVKLVDTLFSTGVSTKEEKDTVLDFIYEIVINYDNIDTNVSRTKIISDIFQQYKKQIPLELLLTTYEINYTKYTDESAYLKRLSEINTIENKALNV